MGNEYKTPCYGDLNAELQTFQQENLVPNINVPSTANTQVPIFIQSKIGIELQIAELRRQQLILDKQHAEEIFKAKELALDAEKKLALTMLDVNPSSAYLPENNKKVFENVSKVSEINVFANASAPPEIDVGSAETTVSAQNIKATGVGLSQLSSLERVKIQLVTAPFVKETYVVSGTDGSSIYRVNISYGALADNKKRTLQGNITNNKLEQVASFRTKENNTMELLVGNEKVCEIKRQSALLKPVLAVSDADDKVVIKIKGRRSWLLGDNLPFFYIETVTKNRIGVINKDLSACQSSNESFESQYSTIEFASDLDVNSKMAVIASSFLIVNTELLATRKNVST